MRGQDLCREIVVLVANAPVPGGGVGIQQLPVDADSRVELVNPVQLAARASRRAHFCDVLCLRRQARGKLAQAFLGAELRVVLPERLADGAAAEE